MRISAGSSFQWFFSLLIWSVFSFGYRRASTTPTENDSGILVVISKMSLLRTVSAGLSDVISLIPYRITGSGVTAERTSVLLCVCPKGACDAPWLICPGRDWDPANILVF